ncbi:hypothetical protein HU200_036261 [Digitaria exilis]|uniref:[RNA-polymerase]-subunit kinase n=1 Tax=Digitaria exilis TaxID=1010633 RepID=A0A835BG84_9POAL|nr:hypothetical protein HU200_036261 [Digitaria exilis]
MSDPALCSSALAAVPMPLTKRPPPSEAEGGSTTSKRRCADEAFEALAASVQSTEKSPKPPASSCTAPAAETTRDAENIPIGRADSYKGFKHLSSGAFGDVWRARHRQTGEEVAVKSLRGGERGRAAALLREAALLAACAGNPGVVELREVVRGGSSGTGNLYLVMEHAGPSLERVIGERRRVGRPFAEAEARRAVRRLLRAVAMMHERGVVHCDLKPGNVLVGKGEGVRGRVMKICDLGLAMAPATVVPPPPPETTSGSSGPVLHGTLWYMAPEQLAGDVERGGAPVDLWSIGCVMAELVAGKPIFQGTDLYKQLHDIVHLLGIPDEVSLMPLGVTGTSPSQLRGAVPEERLSPEGFDVLRGLLEFYPRDRLTAAAALQMPWFARKDGGAASPARA